MNKSYMEIAKKYLEEFENMNEEKYNKLIDKLEKWLSKKIKSKEDYFSFNKMMVFLLKDNPEMYSYVVGTLLGIMKMEEILNKKFTLFDNLCFVIYHLCNNANVKLNISHSKQIYIS